MHLPGGRARRDALNQPRPEATDATAVGATFTQSGPREGQAAQVRRASARVRFSTSARQAGRPAKRTGVTFGVGAEEASAAFARFTAASAPARSR
jgi:hypothetical protein